MLAYDVTSEVGRAHDRAHAREQETFDHAESWLAEVKRYANDNAVVLVVANKCDLADERVVTNEQSTVGPATLLPPKPQTHRSRRNGRRGMDWKF